MLTISGRSRRLENPRRFPAEESLRLRGYAPEKPPDPIRDFGPLPCPAHLPGLRQETTGPARITQWNITASGAGDPQCPKPKPRPAPKINQDQPLIGGFRLGQGKGLPRVLPPRSKARGAGLNRRGLNY